MDRIPCLVIGAGIVGLAVARALQLAGCTTLVVERHPQFGTETSSRNSEVIHAGIYYPPGSLKARLCVRGRQRLYTYCAERAIPHRRLGKLVVASSAAEMVTLDTYRSRGLANGVNDLRMIDAAQLRELEPALVGHAALYSPSTGIVDSHALMLALAADLGAAGGTAVYRSDVQTLQMRADGIVVTLADGYRFTVERLVNCAGLRAPALAAQLGLTTRQPPRWCKGHYYHYGNPSPFNHLIYPVASPGGLGIHVTLDLAGQVRFGPDVRWVDTPDYAFDDSQRGRFIEAIRRYFPTLEPERLTPGYTGIRPKLVDEGAPDGDFVVRRQDCTTRGRAIHLLGIESPGLTAALALADEVRHQLLAR